MRGLDYSLQLITWTELHSMLSGKDTWEEKVDVGRDEDEKGEILVTFENGTTRSFLISFETDPLDS